MLTLNKMPSEISYLQAVNTTGINWQLSSVYSARKLHKQHSCEQSMD